MRQVRLGVNIDHVATVRNARGGDHPDPVRAALVAIAAGADGITAHLREDRRHIRGDDMHRLKESISKPLNFEMAATDEMRSVALSVKPHAACIVPERRQEVTTEGGLDVVANEQLLRPLVVELKGAGMRVSLFIDPDLRQLDAAIRTGAQVVELHTGPYAHASDAARSAELQRLKEAAARTKALGLECHAGHGLTYDNVGPVAALPEIVELNIGHFLVGEAIFGGLDAAVREMRKRIDAAALVNDGAQ